MRGELTTNPLPEYIGELPNICGAEDEIERAITASQNRPVFLGESRIDFARVKSAFANALHMHQPLIPAGGGDLRTAGVIGNLQHMMENQGVGDNHNAPVFLWCYKRMGEFIPQLVREGKEPRIMLEYSGTLFHGLRKMGANDVIDALGTITCDPEYRRCTEWLGAPWGHAVAPSTPAQDYRLHVKAWQHHFAAIFGLEALTRVRGFSPSEMALPNHPDVAYAFVKTLRDCGYQWVLVQEHTVEEPYGWTPRRPHLPHRLVCTNSSGETASIIAIVKTQGSDTKLVAQMQPAYEARSLGRMELAGRQVPPLVSQIADGENGGVMMNEFPPKYIEVMREASHSETPPMNVTEYLEHLFATGIREADLPICQPLFHKQIWEHMKPGDGPERLGKVIDELKHEDFRFHMEGGSWTSNLSWVKGYESVLKPMEEASAKFFRTVIEPGAVRTGEPRYRNALFHLLAAETSCYRYWGEGIWTDYGRELSRRASVILDHDF